MFRFFIFILIGFSLFSCIKEADSNKVSGESSIVEIKEIKDIQEKALNIKEINKESISYLFSKYDSISINYKLIDHIFVKKILAKKINKSKVALLFNISGDDINKLKTDYSLAVHAYTKPLANEKKKYVNWGFKPNEIIRINNEYYMYGLVDVINVDRLNKLEFFLRNREKFIKVIGNRLKAFNVEL